jgi:hypothetical protein
METMLFYLIVNRNGFEESLRVGTEEELESQRIELEKIEGGSNRRNSAKPAWERVTYSLVPKWEWDVGHCPLMPVDLSEAG